MHHKYLMVQVLGRGATSAQGVPHDDRRRAHPQPVRRGPGPGHLRAGEVRPHRRQPAAPSAAARALHRGPRAPRRAHDRQQQAKTASAPLVAVLGYDLYFHDNAAKTFLHFPGIKNAFAEESSRHPSGRDKALLQAGYFIVGVLAAGPTAGFDGPDIDAEFFPDGTFRSVLVVNLGQPGPDAWFDRLPHLACDEVVTTA